jgi:hypothetical protein
MLSLYFCEPEPMHSFGSIMLMISFHLQVPLFSHLLLCSPVAMLTHRTISIPQYPSEYESNLGLLFICIVVLTLNFIFECIPIRCFLGALGSDERVGLPFTAAIVQPSGEHGTSSVFRARDVREPLHNSILLNTPRTRS